jgi:hypothetical protein
VGDITYLYVELDGDRERLKTGPSRRKKFPFNFADERSFLSISVTEVDRRGIDKNTEK